MAVRGDETTGAWPMPIAAAKDGDGTMGVVGAAMPLTWLGS